MQGGPSSIIIVRHGERTDHVDKTFAATYARPHDCPLTPSGIAMAEKLGEYLRLTYGLNSVPADKVLVLSSPLTRCVQTADGILRGLYEVPQGGDVPSSAAKMYMEKSLVEGGFYMFYDMRHNPNVYSQGTSPETVKFTCPEPLLYDSHYMHQHVSKFVVDESKITTPLFNLNSEPHFEINKNGLFEEGIIERCKKGAEGLLKDPFFNGKIVILVAHGETTLRFASAILKSEKVVERGNPPYTAVAYLTKKGESYDPLFEMFTTPHLNK